MQDIYNLQWTDEFGFTSCLCPDCQSGDCTTGAETGVVKCFNCMRENGKIVREHEFDCPECGWHLLGFEDGKWTCRRCLAVFRGDLQSGPGKLVFRPDPCPTCGERFLFPRYSEGHPYPVRYRCQHCETTFPATEIGGNLIHPEHCRACGHTAVQIFRHTKNDWENRRYGQAPARNTIEVKACTVCKALYDMDLTALDKDFNPIIEEDDAPDDVITIGVAQEYDNSLKPMQE